LPQGCLCAESLPSIAPQGSAPASEESDGGFCQFERRSWGRGAGVAIAVQETVGRRSADAEVHGDLPEGLPCWPEGAQFPPRQ